MRTGNVRKRRLDWDDAAALRRECRRALTRMESEFERDGPVAVERLRHNDPLGFIMVALAFALEEESQ